MSADDLARSAARRSHADVRTWFSDALRARTCNQIRTPWSWQPRRAMARRRLAWFCASAWSRTRASSCSSPTIDSRKGRELAAQPRAAAVFHWDTLHRQVRLEGPVLRSPDAGERPILRHPRVRKPARRLGQRAKRAARFTRRVGERGARVDGHAAASRRADRRRQCRGRRIGAASGCGSIRSSCGRKARVACTTARAGRRTLHQEADRRISFVGQGRGQQHAARIPDLLDTFSVGLARLISVVARRGGLARRGRRLRRRCVRFRENHPLPRFARIDAEHCDDRHHHVVRRRAEARAEAHDDRYPGSACWWRYC